jgi:hypothetical protein
MARLAAASVQPGDIQGFHLSGETQNAGTSLSTGGYTGSWQSDSCSNQIVQAGFGAWLNGNAAQSTFLRLAHQYLDVEHNAGLGSQGIGDQDGLFCNASPQGGDSCKEMFLLGTVEVDVWGTDVPPEQVVAVARLIEQRLVATQPSP